MSHGHLLSPNQSKLDEAAAGTLRQPAELAKFRTAHTILQRKNCLVHHQEGIYQQARWVLVRYDNSNDYHASTIVAWWYSSVDVERCRDIVILFESVAGCSSGTLVRDIHAVWEWITPRLTMTS